MHSSVSTGEWVGLDGWASRSRRAGGSVSTSGRTVGTRHFAILCLLAMIGRSVGRSFVFFFLLIARLLIYLPDRMASRATVPRRGQTWSALDRSVGRVGSGLVGSDQIGMSVEWNQIVTVA